VGSMVASRRPSRSRESLSRRGAQRRARPGAQPPGFFMARLGVWPASERAGAGRVRKNGGHGRRIDLLAEDLLSAWLAAENGRGMHPDVADYYYCPRLGDERRVRRLGAPGSGIRIAQRSIG
jgi:hypothetical protein